MSKKFLVLQHWNGPYSEIVECSKKNIRRYAEFCGADHIFVEGKPFDQDLNDYCQKLCVFNDEYDGYDCIVVLDIDIFTNIKLNQNIFTDVSGVCVEFLTAKNGKGWSEELSKEFPGLISANHPYTWGGVIRLEKNIRTKLKTTLNSVPKSDIKKISHLTDEAIYNHLFFLADMKDIYLPDGMKWQFPSNRVRLRRIKIEDAALIHIKDKSAFLGPTKTKMENYLELVSKNIIQKESVDISQI